MKGGKRLLAFVSGRGWRRTGEYCLRMFGQGSARLGRPPWLGSPNRSFRLGGQAVGRAGVGQGGAGALGLTLATGASQRKCQGDTSIKKERCVYSMISTDQMHIHRMKLKPVSDSRVWPTLRHQRRGVEWVLMARITSLRAPIIKLKKMSGGRSSGGGGRASHVGLGSGGSVSGLWPPPPLIP